MKNRPKLTVGEFVEEHSGAPYDVEEVAQMVLDQVEPCELRAKASHFLVAAEAFEEALMDAGFEFG